MPSVYYESPVGIAKITEEEGFITSIHILDDRREVTTPQTEVLKNAVTQLNEYFSGERMVFNLPLKQRGTDFQQLVWQYLQKIPYGNTITYANKPKKWGNHWLYAP